MSRPTKSLLVLDGDQVKLRLLAERQHAKSVVHVDWVRFTCLRRNVAPSVDRLFPLPGAVRTESTGSIWDEQTRLETLGRLIATMPDCDQSASSQAFDLGLTVAEALGPDFKVGEEVKKGHDFYDFRLCIERNGVECGWVGFGYTGKSEHKAAQAATLHVNLFGAACTFAAHAWNERLADVIDANEGHLTRCDLALDFFDGLPGGIESIKADYEAGLCDVGGRRLKCNMVGDWCNGKGRSFYHGSKEAGKQTNSYEKGHQLYGEGSGSSWLRVELRYGNKLRVLSADMLRRPADYFAGASEWHAAMLLKADQIAVPEPVKCNGRLAIETVEAEVVRNLKWVMNTAAASMSAAVQYLGEAELFQVVERAKLPGRLQKFTLAEIKRAFGSAFSRVSSVDSYSPAFA